MHDQKFALVEFQDARLLTLYDGETIRVAMKPLAEAMGYSWQGQHEKITSDPVLREGIKKILIPSNRGDQEMVTLPIHLMHGWLFKLSPSKAKPEFRELVKQYQRECYQVLHDHWMKGSTTKARPALSLSSPTEIIRLIAALKKEGNRAARQTIHELLDQMCRSQGVSTPSIEALGLAESGQEDIQAEFWAAWNALYAKGSVINHHSKPDLIAINLKQMRAAMKEAHIRKPIMAKALNDALRADPRYVRTTSVTSVLGRSVSCWIFRAV